MNSQPVSVQELLTTIQFPDFDVSWAGPGRDRDEFCIGSEDGSIRFMGTDFARRMILPRAARGGEAINGVAFTGSWVAASTREEVAIWSLPSERKGSAAGVSFPAGAHSVVASASGCFIASLGLQGLMFHRPDQSLPGHSDVARAGSKVYFYRVASLLTSDGTEIVASALRQKGVGVMPLHAGVRNRVLGTANFSGLDVIDVCPLGLAGRSAEMAALGKDGTIILFRDAIGDKAPLTLKFNSIEGTAYRLFSARGYLFVLTSGALHAIEGLIDETGAVQQPGPESPVLTIPMEAVDANVAHDRWVLVTLPDRVLRLDADQLRTARPPGEPRLLQKMVSQRLSPTWSTDTLSQVTSSLGLSAACSTV